MEQPNQVNETENHSYWPSVGIAALIFALLTFAIQTIVGYMQISGGTGFIASGISFVVVCLIGAFAGMMAVWHYANEYDLTMSLGRGALIGFLTGAAMVLFSIILGKLWLLIDPTYAERMMEATIERMEAMGGIPDEQIEATRQQAESGQSIIWQLIIGIPVFGILNLLTGMLGVQLFAKEEQDF